MARLGLCSAALLVCATAAVDGIQREPTEKLGLLDPRIPEADPTLYEHIEDGQDYRNPYIQIGWDKITVIVNDSPSGRKRLRVDSGDLMRTLIHLPVSAWPYGRVVALQGFGVDPYLETEPGTRRHQVNTMHRKHQEEAVSVLRSLGVEIELWGSA